MGKIVAIGGGEIGRQGYPVETTGIDKEIIRLSGVVNPRLLFIPTATSDAESYVEAVHKHFGEDLGCTIDTLYLVKEKPGISEIRDKVLNANIIYVGGGNTLKMLKIWRNLGVDKILHEAYERNIVLSGLSAGAICWFRYGSSDSRKFANPDAGFDLPPLDDTSYNLVKGGSKWPKRDTRLSRSSTSSARQRYCFSRELPSPLSARQSGSAAILTIAGIKSMVV
ncbi:Type 1 glutamine amidotransferase-like domain-containing protein [Chloroflexota bacterium]